MNPNHPFESLGGFRSNSQLLEKNMKNILVLVSVLGLSGAFVGLNSAMGSEATRVSVDRVDSHAIRIGHVSLTSEESALWVRGEVMRKIPRRGHIPGHVHIDAYGTGGQALESVVAQHRRPNQQAQKARFAKQLKVDPAEVKSVRLTHHGERHPHI